LNYARPQILHLSAKSRPTRRSPRQAPASSDQEGGGGPSRVVSGSRRWRSSLPGCASPLESDRGTGSVGGAQVSHGGTLGVHVAPPWERAASGMSFCRLSPARHPRWQPRARPRRLGQRRRIHSSQQNAWCRFTCAKRRAWQSVHFAGSRFRVRLGGSQEEGVVHVDTIDASERR